MESSPGTITGLGGEALIPSPFHAKGILFAFSLTRPSLHLILRSRPFFPRIWEWNPLLVFLFNFVAVIPLASLLGNCTEELAFWTGPTIGGLVNATLGNAPELIISIMAMSRGLLRVIQASLLGSVLSNSLLVLGTCFLAGGFKFKTQRFNSKAVSVLSSILFLAAMGVVFPSGLALSDPPISPERVLLLSRVVAVFLIISYGLYLFYTLKTNTEESAGDENAAAEEAEEDSTLSAAGALAG